MEKAIQHSVYSGDDEIQSGGSRAPSAVLMTRLLAIKQYIPSSSVRAEDGSFQALANPSSTIGCLLLLFHALGGSEIPALLFNNGRNPQLRWMGDGAERRMTILEAGINRQLAALIMFPGQFSRAMQELDLLIVSTLSSNGYRTYSLSIQVRSAIRTFIGRGETKWIIKTLKLICFVVPRESIWEPR